MANVSIHRRSEVVLFAASDSGGSAEYIFYQARAMHAKGAWPVLFCTPRYLPGRKISFPVRRQVYGMPKGNVPKLLRRLWQVSALILNFVRLGWWVWRLRPKLLLMDDYREYLAPCWAWALRLGHDPVRDFKIGPDWWHDWSVKQGYSFISIALTHEPVPEYANMPKRILRVVVPHGIYDLPAPTVGLRDLRGRFGVPEGLKVFLAFGFLRDNKNLDLLIRALASAAPGPLTDVVTKFDLGLVVAPDSLDEVVRGMKAILARKWTPGWDDYRAFAGWEANVDALLRAAKLEGADLTAENAKSA